MPTAAAFCFPARSVLHFACCDDPGTVISAVLFAVFVALEDASERFLLTNPHSRWLPIVACVIGLLAYPRLKHWSPA